MQLIRTVCTVNVVYCPLQRLQGVLTVVYRNYQQSGLFLWLEGVLRLFGGLQKAEQAHGRVAGWTVKLLTSTSNCSQSQRLTVGIQQVVLWNLQAFGA